MLQEVVLAAEVAGLGCVFWTSRIGEAMWTAEVVAGLAMRHVEGCLW